MTDINAIAQKMVVAVRDVVARAEAALNKRIDALDERLKAIPAGAPGKDGIDGKSVDPAEVKAMVDTAVAALPVPKDGEPGGIGPPGKDAVLPDIGAMVRSAVADEVKALPAPKNGENGLPGKDFDPILAKELVESEVSRVFAEFPKPKDGDRGDVGLAGKDAVLPDIAAMVAEAVSKACLTLAADIADSVKKAVAEIPVPKNGVDGKDAEPIHPDTIFRMVSEQVTKAVAELPKPVDGKNGKDAPQVTVLPSIDKTRSYQAGTWAKYCGGTILAERTTEPFEDDISKSGWTVVMDGVSAIVVTQADDFRTLSVATMLTSGIKAECEFVMPVVIDRGVWRDGEFEKGDHVSWDGSGWICQKDTTDKPGVSDAWRLSTKRGRDGRDGDGKAMPRAPLKLK